MIRIFLLLAAVEVAAFLFACGLGNGGPFFTPQALPENQEAFNQGRLGLLTPALTKQNKIIAFRILSGLKMDEKLGQAGGRLRSIMADPAQVRVLGQQAWEQARRTVSDPPMTGFGYINSYRNSRSSSAFVFYLNCLDDAFETAARTLEDRRQHYSSSADFAAWVRAQDQVFTNCSSEQPAYPEAPASSAPTLVRADREYQIAAAHFYAEDLPEAEKRFRAIAADAKSPWRYIGNYIVGRTLLRETSLGKSAAAESLARQQFAAVAADSATASLAASARGLMQHLDAIEHPGTAMDSLSKQLLLPRPTPEAFTDALQQSAYILTTDAFDRAWSQPDVPELFRWVHALDEGDAAHALQQFQTRHSLPWLTLALLYTNGKDQTAAELIESADRLSPNSPAYGTGTYNAVRLRMERGETERPRRQLDALLAHSQGQPDSLVNGWRAERMQLATSFDDLLRWAPRVPIDEEVFSNTRTSSPVLDSDAAYILNYCTPLTKLAVAAQSKKLPPWSAADIALAAWTRAVMLNNSVIAGAVAPIVAKAHPQWASSLSPGSNEPKDRWKFRAALLIALHHEFQPLVPVDYRKHSDYFYSWWCPMAEPGPERLNTEDSTVAWRLPIIFTLPKAVISPEERSRAEAELDQLHRAGSAQSFLAPIIFAWAKAHPDDRLVPQALHRLVMVVRYGCHGDETTNGRISKTAFDLLHRRYPKSEWTAKTPYWFK